MKSKGIAILGISLLTSWQAYSSSSGARASQTAAAALKASALAIGGIPGTGIAGHYFLTGDFQIVGGYISGSIDIADQISDEGTTYVDKAEITGTLTTVEARYFLGNSFFVAAGLGQRVISSSSRIESSTTDLYIELDTESTSTVISAALGNIWSWDSGFFFGFEWIGFTVPIGAEFSTKTTSNIPAGDSTFDTISEDTEDLAKNLGESPAPGLLTLNIGFAF